MRYMFPPECYRGKRTCPVSKLAVAHSITHSDTTATPPARDGNELSGSFYLTYSCESTVTSTTADVTNGNANIVLGTAAVAGDTLRVNTNTGSADGSTAWRYFMISSISGTTATVENVADVDFDGANLEAEFGDFYSGPGMDYGVSTGCLQADPDSTNNPLAHNVDPADLQNELQGLPQVDDTSDCLTVRIAMVVCACRHRTNVPTSQTHHPRMCWCVRRGFFPMHQVRRSHCIAGKGFVRRFRCSSNDPQEISSRPPPISSKQIRP